MMSILYRRNQRPNIFREALLELIDSEQNGDTLILSYGYITKEALKGKILTGNIIKGLPKGGTLKILGVNARDKVKYHDGTSHMRNTPFGRFNVCNQKGCSYCDYLRFIEELETDLKQYPINVEAYLAEKFHGKIAIKLFNGHPIATICGSSNLSDSAFGENSRYWNYECDIYMLDDDIITLSGFVSTKAREEKEEFIESYDDIIEAFHTRSYALEIIPVDSRYPDKTIMERLYSEINYLLQPKYRV